MSESVGFLLAASRLTDNLGAARRAAQENGKNYREAPPFLTATKKKTLVSQLHYFNEPADNFSSFFFL